jgi:twitching motility protein PilT
VADADGLTRYPACEIMIATGTIRDYIREAEKTVLIRQAIQEGFIQYQMQTFDQSLMQLYKEKKITLEAATKTSSNPHEFMLRVKGIQASSDKTWDRFEEPNKEPEPEIQTI